MEIPELHGDSSHCTPFSWDGPTAPPARGPPPRPDHSLLPSLSAPTSVEPSPSYTAGVPALSSFYILEGFVSLASLGEK